MKKGSITRYDQELVMETIADYDNLELSAWVLEPVKEQIGGGGGLDNPSITMTVNASTAVYFRYYILDNNEIVAKTEEITGTHTYDSLVIKSDFVGEESYELAYSDLSSYTITASNAVNCTADTSYGIFITITDPSQPASITINIS